MNESVLRQLLDIGRQMAETRDLEPLLVYAVDVAITLLKAEYGYLIMVDADGSFQFRVHRDEQGNDIENPAAQVSKTLIYRVTEEGRAFISANVSNEFSNVTSAKNLRLRSLVCVPLIARGKHLGVIYLENRQERGVFLDTDIEPLQYLAGYAAVCIENAMLNKELEFMAQHKEDDLAQANLQEAGAMELERVRLVYNFIQDASHQFRTPLSVINANVDLLSRKINNPAYEHHFQGIRGQVRAVVQLVDSLLLMVKLDSLHLEVTQAYDLNQLAKEMFEIRMDAAKRKQLDYQIQLEEESIEVRGVIEYMRQAVKHVIENAVQYTRNGGQITLKVFRRGSDGVVELHDTGVGISAEEQKRVFTRFYRGDKAGTSRGLGLGMSIAQKIMLLHNGRIELESQEEHGTVVRLIFPIASSN
jgi:signal transduction histidine kinase